MPRTGWTAAVAVAIVVAAGWALWHTRVGDGHSVSQTTQQSVADTAPQSAARNTSLRSPDSTPATRPDISQTDSIGAEPYPVDLDALRARLPGNRYWERGAPTSDPAVARQRAARAERDNAAFGRIQANEASPDEIRAYYAERRAISRDYLQLAELVLAERGATLPERDRGMFELSANLHRARLQQIERDESDALTRIGAD